MINGKVNISAIREVSYADLLGRSQVELDMNMIGAVLITRYEILRGLKAKGATKQAMVFDRFYARNAILPLIDEAVVKAAEIYADLSGRGVLIGDADILIAASALVYGLGVVTNNENHFKRIRGLHVENWLK